MAHDNCKTRRGSDLPTIVLLGANSGAARAISRIWPADKLVQVHRGAGPGVEVPEYDSPPKSALISGSVIVNCVGTPQGSPAHLDRINRQIPCKWAEAARDHGVAAFIQLSSLSVYGPARLIGRDTPLSPTSNYGVSKLAAEYDLARIAENSFRLATIRIPMLFGKGPDKLSRLIGAFKRANVVPKPSLDIRRSMLSYSGLGLGVARIAAGDAAGTLHLGDPQVFTYGLVARALGEQLRTPRSLQVPALANYLIAKTLPSVHARLLASSEISGELLYDNTIPERAGLAEAVCSLVREGRYPEECMFPPSRIVR